MNRIPICIISLILVLLFSSCTNKNNNDISDTAAAISDIVAIAETTATSITITPVITEAATVTTTPTETTAFSESETVITIPDLIEKPIINHQIPPELIPFFERANRVLATEFAGYAIANESGRRITIKYSDDEFFTPYDKTFTETIGLYIPMRNEIHLKGIKNTDAIYHEMIHERTVMFWNLFNSYGSGLNEGLTSLLALELFDVQHGYLGERRLVKILTEIIGFENVILPFIDGGNINDIANAIDAAYGESGYGIKIIHCIDKYTEADELNSYLSYAQIMLIDLFFTGLTNKVNQGANTTDINAYIEKAFSFKALLIINMWERTEDGSAHSFLGSQNLNKVGEYYEMRLNEFISMITDIDPAYVTTIETIKSSFNIETVKDYYRNKNYIYHGKYADEYRITEWVNTVTDGRSVTIRKHQIPINSADINESVIWYRKERYLSEEANIDNGRYYMLLNPLSYQFDNINNSHPYFELIRGNPNKARISFTIDGDGFITLPGDNDIDFSMLGEIFKSYYIGFGHDRNDTHHLFINIIDVVKTNPDSPIIVQIEAAPLMPLLNEITKINPNLKRIYYETPDEDYDLSHLENILLEAVNKFPNAQQISYYFDDEGNEKINGF